MTTIVVGLVRIPRSKILLESFSESDRIRLSAAPKNTCSPLKKGGAEIPLRRNVTPSNFPSNASDNDQVYLPLDDGKLIALDARTGCTRWTFAAKAGVRTAMTVAPRAGVRGATVYSEIGRAHV